MKSVYREDESMPEKKVGRGKGDMGVKSAMCNCLNSRIAVDPQLLTFDYTDKTMIDAHVHKRITCILTFLENFCYIKTNSFLFFFALNTIC